MNDIEALRQSFRPDKILTLFVGESAPKGTTFFYKKDSQAYRCMQEVLKGGDGFLEEFREKGFFLDDLVLEPCNHKSQGERKQLHRECIPHLAKRLTDYRPLAVVSIMKLIGPAVEEACRTALPNIQHYNVPFPGNGQQTNFRRELQRILPKLPHNKA